VNKEFGRVKTTNHNLYLNIIFVDLFAL